VDKKKLRFKNKAIKETTETIHYNKNRSQRHDWLFKITQFLTFQDRCQAEIKILFKPGASDSHL
jgi:hypothetical protein